MAIKKKTVHYRVDGCACLQGFVNIGDCDDDNIYDAAGAPVPGAVITPAGDCPQEVVIVCGNEAPPEPPPPPEPPEDLVLTGKDCDGNDVEVTGPPGEVVGVVQAPGTVFKVQLCENPRDTEKVVLCDKNTNHKVAVISDLTDPAAPIVTFWDLNAGAAWEGDVEDLQACPGVSLESDAVEACDGGTQFLRWIVKDAGEPTGDKFDTDLAGAPYTVADEAAVTLGKCPEAACDPTISSAFGDALGTLLPGNTVSVIKPTCCAISVVTSAGTFIVPKGVGAYSTSTFNCSVTVDSITILSGGCTDDEILVTTQSAG